MPLVSRTRATLRSAEFGFFSVWVNTRTQTPRFCGLFWSAGLLVLVTIFLRPSRTSWLIVGIRLRAPKIQNDSARRGRGRQTLTGETAPARVQAWKPSGLAPGTNYP